MRSNVAKIGIAGLGLYVVSRILKSVSAASSSFAPRGMSGYDAPMIGYDPLAEAVGCACGGTFDDADADGLGFSLKKTLKKGAKKFKKMAIKKPLKVFKKMAIKKPLRALKKSAKLVKRDFSKATQPLVRDFRKAGKLMKTDFSRAGAMFGKKKGNGDDGGGGVEYQDINGNIITEAEYNQQQAQLDAEYDQSPGIMPGADQSNDDAPTFSMEEHAASMVGNESTPIAAQMFDPSSSDFADLTTIPGDQFDTFNRAPVGWSGEQDPYAAERLPEWQREQTMDVYAGEQTSDNSVIIAEREPSVPYTAAPMIAYERPDDEEGEWSPDSDGSNYGNINQGGYEVPGFNEGYDWDGGVDGLGDLVANPRFHGTKKPCRMVVVTSDGATPIQADRRGNLFARRGGSLRRLGNMNRMTDGQGWAGGQFGRRFTSAPAINTGLGGWADFLKKATKTSKKVASRVTPSGFLYSRLKKNPKLYREYRKGAKVAMPYVMIVGGVVVSVVSLGTAAPVGASMMTAGVAAAIAGGVVSAGAQAYSDVKTREAEKLEEKAIEEVRLQEAIASNGTIQESYGLNPSDGPSPGEIPGGDWPWEYAGDGVMADFLDLSNSFQS